MAELRSNIVAAICLLLLLSTCVKQVDPAPAPQPRRGFWLTNIDSEAMFTRAGLEQVVEDAVRLGFNTIYPVVWNDGYTLYPSQLMQQTFGYAIDPAFAGRDPLQELIELAHDQDIEVIAWFEFGFASSYDQTDGGPILRNRPDWAARDTAGQIVSKNNFQWMNAFDPEVQQFMIDLLKEVVIRYDVDGIQGDDRLPALPSLAGYDSLTLMRYAEAHAGQLPPDDPRDSAWVAWRVGILNNFMERLCHEVRELDPQVTLSFAPSIYPWSKYEYLQDWPTWVAAGWVDEIIPQVYRYDIDAYQNALQAIVEQQIPQNQQNLLFPGVLLKVGDYVATDSLLAAIIASNRAYGIQGEVFFFYEGIRRRPDFFQQLYAE